MMTKLKTFAPSMAKYLLGLIFFLSGLAGLLGYGKPPEGTPETLLGFVNAMEATKFFLPLLKSTETVCGLLLLTGFAPALALVILAPITVQIFFTHAFLTPGLQNLILPVIMIGLHCYAASAYWRIYRPLFNR